MINQNSCCFLCPNIKELTITQKQTLKFLLLDIITNCKIKNFYFIELNCLEQNAYEMITEIKQVIPELNRIRVYNRLMEPKFKFEHCATKLIKKNKSYTIKEVLKVSDFCICIDIKSNLCDIFSSTYGEFLTYAKFINVNILFV